MKNNTAFAFTGSNNNNNNNNNRNYTVYVAVIIVQTLREFTGSYDKRRRAPCGHQTSHQVQLWHFLYAATLLLSL